MSKSLNIALVTRPGSIPGKRNVGWWAYSVPEFIWKHVEAPKHSRMDRGRFATSDLIVWEDGKSSIEWYGKGPPLALVVSDSTLSEEHYQKRLRMAKQADIILVDWDRLERFEGLGKPVRRFSHAVNDLRFRDYGLPKDVDVAYHVNEDTPERRELGDWLAAFCRERGYTYARGVREGDEYARAFNRAKVTVNLNRNPQTRNHRLFDAMACRTCLLTDPVPEVSGEHRIGGRDYNIWHDRCELAECIADAVPHDLWRNLWTDSGYALVRGLHTWRWRAEQLRATLTELGIG